MWQVTLSTHQTIWAWLTIAMCFVAGSHLRDLREELRVSGSRKTCVLLLAIVIACGASITIPITYLQLFVAFGKTGALEYKIAIACAATLGYLINPTHKGR